MTALTVVAYNVLFGDAILICIPDHNGRKTIMRHVLIDVGNVLGAPDSNADVFRSIITDINRRLDGQSIDLYVMTHEHMDHVQGLLCAHSVGQKLPEIDYAWLTASARRDYYEQFTQADKQRRLYLAAYDRVQRIALHQGIVGLTPIKAFLDNNNPRKTGDCVAFLRKVARKKTSYVHREFIPVAGKTHPFREATFSIWAPEHDTSSYYGRMRPVPPIEPGQKLEAPEGVEQRAFDALLKFSQTGLGDEMLAIDRAANNTSVVFSIEWRGWRLLFTGDAELRSWRTMEQQKQLRPVHFIKVGHHASHNGTPDEDLLEQILPLRRPDSRRRIALVSTCENTYNGVPDHDTLARLERRVDALIQTDQEQVPVGSAVEIRFEDQGDITVTG
jgi:beta-lactamase superfamily II metal-dependent hydrolase